MMLTRVNQDVDCSETVKRVYACADTSWTLWEYNDMFCCQADEVGTQSGGEKCLPTNIPVPTSIIVSSVGSLILLSPTSLAGISK